MSDLDQVREAYGSGQYAEVISTYDTATDATDPEVHLYGCMALEKVGRVHEARWAVERAVALGPGGELAVKVRWMRGYICRHLGDCHQALQDFDLCLAEVSRYPELEEKLAGALQYNRGLALMPYGRRAEAMAAYAQAAEVFRAQQKPTWLRMALQNLAWVAAELDRQDLASQALAEAQPLCADDDAEWRQEVTMAWVLRHKGQNTEAMAICRRIEGAAVPADAACLAAVVIAHAACDLGLVDVAVNAADLAVERSLAVMAPDSRCLNAAQSVQQRARKMRRDEAL